MKNTLIILFLAICINFINAQVPVGLVNDIDGMPFNGYYDALGYSPNEKLTITNNHSLFEPGYYYDKSGKKILGFIQIAAKKIRYKKEYKIPYTKIKISEVGSFVIGIDSFIVISNNGSDPKFAQYLGKYKNYTFVRSLGAVKSEMGINLSPKYSENSAFLIQSDNNNTWKALFHNKKTFNSNLLEYFADIPLLKQRIIDKTYMPEDLLSILKMAINTQKFTNSEKIVCDSFWQELPNTSISPYFAKITSIRDSIWTFEYYKNKDKLYKVNYSSFSPNIKNGNFVAYYSNGQIRKIIRYHNNKPQLVKLFEKKGAVKSTWKYIEIKQKRDTLQYIKYSVINDSLGKNILKSNDKVSRIHYDAINNRKVVQLFDKHELMESYYISGEKKIYQITNLNFDYKLKLMQSKLTAYIFYRKEDMAYIAKTQGTLLMHFIVNPNGWAVEGKLLNSLHPKVDSIIADFIKNKFLEGAQFRYKFKDLKNSRSSHYWEIIVPVEIKANRFYIPPNRVNLTPFRPVNNN